ncbi:CBN-GLB-33 protein [Caenorhabditis brenneri]|uniref:CBN-GLB-33 protein n=1 Tax=Caenorhabditis brenneri TaxID=135651 RepID=G0M9B0_CAEBE|nr:CBN-GLB-33 protein [Caenorhabditis brenneri]
MMGSTLPTTTTTTTTLAPLLLNDTLFDDFYNPYPNISHCFKSQHTPTYQKFSILINGYISTAVIVLGTIGNLNGVKSVHMTALDRNKGVVLGVSMLALAFWDTVLLWSALFYYGIKRMGLPESFHIDQLNQMVPFFHMFSHIANTASTWCVVAITLQRFMATRDPFRTSRSTVIMQSFRSERRISFIYCATYRRLFKMPAILSITAVFLNLPSFWEIECSPCFSTATNTVKLQLVPTWLRLNPNYSVYRLFIRMFLVSVGPNILIIVVSACTLFFLRGSNRSRRQLFKMTDNLLERYASRESMNTMIAVLLVAKFLLFRSVTFVLDIMEVTVGLTNYYMIDISNFLVLVNSATNCLIYLKATEWLSSKLVERKTIKRKKTICDSGQLLGDRLSILISSWEKANEMTNGEIGVRVAWNMVRKHPTMCKADEPEKVSLLNGSCKRSIDHAKFQEIGGRISAFISELLELMQNNQPESYIVMRVRRVGAVHYDKGIVFTSSVWKEFKHTIQTIISEVQFSSPQEREAALDAWNIFISFIIREMKMGTWAIGETIGQMP